VRKRFGWWIYATDQPAEELNLQKAVLAYRDEYVIERCFGRLKGNTGSLLEFTVRRRLAEEGKELNYNSS